MMPQVEQLARRFCHAEAVHVQVGSEDPLTGNRDIHQEILFCENQREKVGKMYSKMQELTAQYGETSKYLVFVKSKRGAAALAGSLEYQGMPKVGGGCLLVGGRRGIVVSQRNNDVTTMRETLSGFYRTRRSSKISRGQRQ